MGKLIDQSKRKQASEQRAQTRTKVLDAALRCYLIFPFTKVDLETVRKRAKVRTGVPSLLFGSIGCTPSSAPTAGH